MARDDSKPLRTHLGTEMQDWLPFAVTHALAPTDAVAARNTTAITSEAVTIIADADFFWAVGDVSVVATAADGWWPANVPLDLPMVTADSYVSLLRADGTGAMIARIYERG